MSDKLKDAIIKTGGESVQKVLDQYGYNSMEFAEARQVWHDIMEAAGIGIAKYRGIKAWPDYVVPILSDEQRGDELRDDGIH